MSVATVVNAIPGMDGQAFNAFPSTCHFATSYWLYTAEFGNAPTVNRYLTGVNLTGLSSEIAGHGTRLKRPGNAGIAVPAGTVLVFVSDGQAGHSCIVRADGQIGGYNQENWFTTAGNNHRYSQHDVTEISWASGKTVQRPNLGHIYELYATDEIVARSIVRSQFQR